MIEERHNISRAQFTGMNPRSGRVPMKFQIAAHPLRVSPLRPETVVFHPQNLAQLIQQFGFWIGNHERSLCWERFQSPNHTIFNKGRKKRNQNLSDTQKAYARVWCPNNC